MTCRESVSLGAYVLGALEPAERSAMERHLAGCGFCREELLSFAPLPGLLRHTPFEELPEVYEPLGTLVPVEPEDIPVATPFEPFGLRQNNGGGSSPGPGHSSAPGSEGHGSRKGRGNRAAPGRPPRRRRIMAVAAVAVAACASAVFLLVEPDPDRPPPRPSRQPVASATLSAVDPDTRVSASAALTPKAWGTAVSLKLGGLPKNIRCAMVIHSRSGRSETAGSWASGYYGSSTIPAATSVHPEEISRIDIVSDEGALLVSLPRPRESTTTG